MRTYIETFDDGPGGWSGWIDNALGHKRLEVHQGAITSRSPWWIDYNHAPPGAGYLNLLFMLQTKGIMGEHAREVCGRNRFVEGRFPTNFAHAKITARLKGELEARGASLHFLFNAMQGDVCVTWLMTSQSLVVTPEWSEQTMQISPNPAAWKWMGARHDRTDFYGHIDLGKALSDVNRGILLVLFPLDVAPMGPIPGDQHILRPEKDYPVWRSRLPEGYVMLDTIRIDYAD